ncbi:Glutamate-ammonia-ligase adenylyltransferase, partial [hydrothermal vent metagenome]
MKPPEWLPTFPFLQTQWPEIMALSKIYPELKSHDLNLDWQAFSVVYQQSNPIIDWFAKLRQFRKSRLAYLAYHDLFKSLDEHLETMHRVSDLADLLIQKAHQIAAADMAAKHGLVIDASGEPVEMMVWALGKLGTRELNYSSDVDLVFLYSQDGVSNGKRSLEASSYFIRLGQKIIKLLDHFTQDGQVYRVDMRLRPFGSAGPLACSVGALQQYLQYEGREWERFAWMRARMVSTQSAVDAEV